jgi:hypothetical protein
MIIRDKGKGSVSSFFLFKGIVSIKIENNRSVPQRHFPGLKRRKEMEHVVVMMWLGLHFV